VRSAQSNRPVVRLVIEMHDVEAMDNIHLLGRVGWLLLLATIGCVVERSNIVLTLLFVLAVVDLIPAFVSLAWMRSARAVARVLGSYLLIGFTNGIVSDAYYLLLASVVLAACEIKPSITLALAVLAAILYSSFLLFVIPSRMDLLGLVEWSLARTVLVRIVLLNVVAAALWPRRRAMPLDAVTL
jgi:hypothetical protein